MKVQEVTPVLEAFQMTEARRSDNSEWPERLHRAWNQVEGKPGSLWIDPEDPARHRLVFTNGLGAVLQVVWDSWFVFDSSGLFQLIPKAMFDWKFDEVHEADLSFHDALVLLLNRYVIEPSDLSPTDLADSVEALLGSYVIAIRAPDAAKA